MKKRIAVLPRSTQSEAALKEQAIIAALGDGLITLSTVAYCQSLRWSALCVYLCSLRSEGGCRPTLSGDTYDN